MSFPVIKSAGYVLVNTPDMIMNMGSTFTNEKILNPDSDLFEKAKRISVFFRNILVG